MTQIAHGGIYGGLNAGAVGVARAASAYFSPASIAGLKLWLKADAITASDGDAIGTWTDASGNGNNATQSNATYKPLYKTNIQNGKPIVRFDGSNDNLRSAAFASELAQPNTIIAVWKTTSTTSLAQIIIDGLTNGKRNSILTTVVSGVRRAGVFAGGADSSDWTRTYPESSFFIVSIIVNGATTTAYQNGSAVTWSRGTPDATHPGTNTMDGICIGQRGYDAAFPWGGDVAEVLIYNAALSSGERTSVENYLNAKYAIY